ncbi:MAG: hypothetical protein CMP22_05855 [Rickettsiales bacterium]|nr:hypothetical protein [Rickettsiales bacterium]
MREAQDICHGLVRQSGWWTDLKTGKELNGEDRNMGELLMLCVTELAEAMEGARKSLKDDKLPHRDMVEVELADTIIRILDLSGGYGLDVGGALAEKLAFNMTREDHKIDVRKATGGKKF